MPAFCGRTLTLDVHKAFITMVRNRTREDIARFYSAARQLHSTSTDKTYQNSLSPILASEAVIDEILLSNDSSSLDPAIPSFFFLCAEWGDRFGECFNVLHDDSKPIFQDQGTLEMCMSKDIPHEAIGYDRRKFGFPLKANGIRFAASKDDPRLQVVDMLAGSLGYWASGLASGNTEDHFWKDLNEQNIGGFLSDAVWPNLALDPSQIGTDSEGGINSVEYMTEALTGR